MKLPSPQVFLSILLAQISSMLSSSRCPILPVAHPFLLRSPQLHCRGTESACIKATWVFQVVTSKDSKVALPCLAPLNDFSNKPHPLLPFLLVLPRMLACVDTGGWQCTRRAEVEVGSHPPALFQLTHLDRVSQSSPELPGAVSIAGLL